MPSGTIKKLVHDKGFGFIQALMVRTCSFTIRAYQTASLTICRKDRASNTRSTREADQRARAACRSVTPA